MAMTAQVKDELSRLDGHQAVLPQGRGVGDAALRRRAAHRHRPDRRRGRAGHRRGRPPAAQGHRRGLRPHQRGRWCWPAAACARAAATSCGWSRTARRWPGRPACSTSAAGRCAGCRPQVVAGAVCDAEAAWRGAFLAHGSLTEPGRSSALEVTCPGPEAALALVGAARRLGIPAKAREVRGVDRVVVRDGDAIGALLTRLGAHDSVLAWEERRMRREVRATANRLANFDDANLRRSARAAVAAGARVERALEILGDDVPDHLREAGTLRLEHKQAVAGGARPARRPADDQGRHRRPDPPAAGDGRQARQDLGIPGHRGRLTPDMLDA